MRVKILFFASTRELTGKTQMMMDFNDSDAPLVTSDLLLLKLMELYPDLQIDENNISIAINQVYCRESVVLKDGDIIALLPPISGG